MRALIIDSEARARAAKVKQNALTHRQTISNIIRRMAHPEETPGADPAFVLMVREGFKAVLTVEQQPEPYGWLWHLSVSVSQSKGSPPLCPHPSAVAALLDLFGMDPLEEAVMVYAEEKTIVHVMTRYREEADPQDNALPSQPCIDPSTPPGSLDSK